MSLSRCGGLGVRTDARGGVLKVGLQALKSFSYQHGMALLISPNRSLINPEAYLEERWLNCDC